MSITIEEIKVILASLNLSYLGIQEGYKDIPDHVLFNDSTQDTLAVSVDNFSFEAVVNRLKRAEKEREVI
jgi:hypothetical protein